jgi:hypothetical protein
VHADSITLLPASIRCTIAARLILIAGQEHFSRSIVGLISGHTGGFRGGLFDIGTKQSASSIVRDT